MIKLLTIALVAVLATGCATQRQTYSASGQEATVLTCSGTARDWTMCYKAAGDKCKTRGYTVLDKSESTNRQVRASATTTSAYFQSAAVVERNMTITCN